MESNISISQNEEEIAKQLFTKGFLPWPMLCKWRGVTFYINHDSYNQTSHCCFKCNNYRCRMKYPIRKNSFYSKYSFFPLWIVSEIISCFFCKEFNAEKAKTYIINEFNYNISKNAIYNIYREIRECIYKYMKFLYETEYIAEANANEISHVMNLWLDIKIIVSYG